MIKQFVPQDVCLKCRGCCRFREENSVWAPCLLEEEIQDFIGKDIPAAYLSLDKRIKPVPDPKGENFICAFFNTQENKCRIYANRPFECQLYPFLLCLRDKKVLLTVDLHCPYIKDKLNTAEFKDYVSYLTDYLNTPAQLRMLRDNPQILQAYEEALSLIELETDNETA